MVLLVLCGISNAATLYVSQSGGSVSCGGDGTQTTISVATLNSTGADWVAGNTNNLCGTITSQIVANGNGSSGNPIVLRWESNAVVNVCNGSSGAVNVGSHSWITLDTNGQVPAITCPNNGTGLSTQLSAWGVSGNGASNIEIKGGGQIGPMFLYSGTAQFDEEAYVCVNYILGTNLHVHHVTLAGCANGNIYQLSESANSTTDEWDHLTIPTTTGRVLNYSYGDDTSHSSTNPRFHDNDVNFTSVWQVANNCSGDSCQHYEFTHSYIHAGSSGDSAQITNFLIYNNYMHGATPNNGSTTGGFNISTGAAEAGSGLQTVYIFNNLMVNTGGVGWSGQSGGFVYIQDTKEHVSVFNNTFVNNTNTTNSAWEVNAFASSAVQLTAKNNIVSTMQFGPYNPDNGATISYDYNDYYNLPTSGYCCYQQNNNQYVTIAQWRTATSQDTNSITTNPGLNGDYTITSTSSNAYQKGTNLTSLCSTIAQLCTGAPQTFGVNGSCGTGCLTRAPSGSWDLGAYPYQQQSGGGGSQGGIGTQTIQHQVNLTWSPNVSAQTYNVYRSLTSGTGYTLLVAVPAQLTYWTDTTVTSGTTYYYKVNYVDSGGEHAWVSEQQYVIPFP